MLRYTTTMIALGAFLLMPATILAHPDHDLSEAPELQEVEPENDWVAIGVKASGENARMSYAKLYGFLFPVVWVSGTPFQQDFGSGPQAVQFATVEEESIEGMFVEGSAPGNTKLVAKRPGTYEFMGGFRLTHESDHAAFDYRLEIKKYDKLDNLVRLCGKDARNDLTSWRALRVQGIVNLDEDEYLRMTFTQNSGGTVSVSTNWCWFFMRRIGPYEPE